jgi:NAD(P)-dependent dehydrogenase (short-subunit alcohol dehydrogenase family)
VRLEDRTAIVTGAASGSGRAIAQRFAEEGALVMVADVDEPGGTETVARIVDAGGRAVFSRCDVTRRDDVEATVRDAVALGGRLDVMVANAGINAHSHFLELTDDEWDRVLAVNLNGTFYCGQAAALAMTRLGGGGTIVAIVVGVALVALVAYFATHVERRLAWLPTGMLLGGAVGNIVDRVRAGGVTDFVKLPHWPAFNVADMAITLGVLVLLYVIERGDGDRRRA